MVATSRNRASFRCRVAPELCEARTITRSTSGDFVQTFADGRRLARIYLQTSPKSDENEGRTEGSAWEIRGRNTNSFNTINYFLWNILSFCFTFRKEEKAKKKERNQLYRWPRYVTRTKIDMKYFLLKYSITIFSSLRILVYLFTYRTHSEFTLLALILLENYRVQSRYIIE